MVQAVEKWGALDVMFNNAGFGGVSGPIEDTDMDGYDQTMAVLLRGVFLGVKHAAGVMKAQRSGCIINTASVAALQAGFGPHVYSAAKAGVLHLTRSVAPELGEFGVRANAICPGFIGTNIFTTPFGLQRRRRRADDQQAQRCLRRPCAAAPHGRPERHRPDRGVACQRCRKLRHRAGDRG